MNSIEAIIIAIVEGLTEFLPVSSTGHMIITQNMLGVESTDFVKAFTVIIQFGAILSVVCLYWNRFFRLNPCKIFDAEAVRDLHAVKGRTAIWTEKNKTMLVLQSMVLLFFLPVIADHSVHYIDWLSLKKGPQIIHSNVHQTLAAFLWRPGNMRRNDTILRF